jgi:hypothetical protein
MRHITILLAIGVLSGMGSTSLAGPAGPVPENDFCADAIAPIECQAQSPTPSLGTCSLSSGPPNIFEVCDLTVGASPRHDCWASNAVCQPLPPFTSGYRCGFDTDNRFATTDGPDTAGTPCQSPATRNTWCFWHDPERSEEEKRAAASKGGLASRPSVLPEAADIRLRTPDGCMTILEETASQVRRGELAPNIANSIGYLVDRVVFGTDWPYDMALDWPVSWILGMRSLSQEEKEAILYKNLERLLNI